MIFDDRGGPNFLADRRVDRRNGGDAVEESPNVQTCSSHQDRQAPGRMDGIDLGLCECRPICGGTGLRAVADTIEAMLGPFEVVACRRGAEDGQVAIYLRAISVDDDSVSALGQLQRKRRLAARRRTGDERNWRTPGFPYAHCHADSSRTAR